MNSEFIQRLTDIVEANLANEAFGTEEAAKEMGMSHANLHRKLKKISNQTISQFIREARLKKARELLHNEEVTISEISYQVGFGSPTYFNKCFHEYFGFTPGEYKTRELSGELIEKQVNTSIYKKEKTKKLLILVCTIIIFSLSAIYLVNNVSVLKSENAQLKSIAVLPFKYLSDEPGKQYLADGMMDAILIHLSKIKDLRVISRTSVEQFRNTKLSSRTIGQKLGAAYLLDASFQKEKDRVRLIIWLIRTSDDDHVWSNEYNRDWKDIFSVQSEIAETVASELQAVITPEEKQLIRKKMTSDLTAYDFFQRGREEFNKYEHDNSNRSVLETAQKFYEKALEYDSSFAQAYTGLAEVHWNKRYWEKYFTPHFMDSVYILSNIALSFDPQLAEAYYLRGICYYEYGNPEKALAEYDKAIKFDPNDWKSYLNRAKITDCALGDFVGAINYTCEALTRNRGKELPNILVSLGLAYLDAGFPDKTTYYLKEAMNLDGDSASYFGSLTWVEFYFENFENALALARKAYQADSNYVYELLLNSSFCGYSKESSTYAEKYVKLLNKFGNVPIAASHRIGYSYWQVGRYEEAKRYFNQQIKYDLESIALGRFIAIYKQVQYDLAAVYAFLGNKEKAYQYLDDFTKKRAHASFFITMLKNDPLLDNIRGEQRFQTIVKKVEAKNQAEHERVGKWMQEQEKL